MFKDKSPWKNFYINCQKYVFAYVLTKLDLMIQDTKKLKFDQNFFVFGNGKPTRLQVNDYEIVVNFFHISHNLT